VYYYQLEFSKIESPVGTELTGVTLSKCPSYNQKSPLVGCPPFAMLPFVPTSFGDIVTAASIVHSIYKALSDSMGASYDYQYLIMELRSFEQALKIVDLAITAATPSGRDTLDIAAEITTCLELLKTFYDRIRSYQKALGGGKGASWRKIGWSLLKADEVAIFRQKISHHKQNMSLFLNGLTV
jgi:hypothetical protein